MKPRTLWMVLFCGIATTPAWADAQLTGANCASITGTVGFYTTYPLTYGLVDIFDGPVLIMASVAANPNFMATTPSALKDNQAHTITAKMQDGYGGYVGLSGSYALTCTQDAPGYHYDYSDSFSSLSTTNWTVNGVTPTTGSNGLGNSSSSGSSLVYKNTVPGVANSYEVKTTIGLTASGGIYDIYLRSSTNALPNQGTYYLVELQNPTFSGTACTATLLTYKVISGTTTQLSSATIPCHNGMVIRGIYDNHSTIWVFVDGLQYVYLPNSTAIASGQPGIGLRSAPAGNSIWQAEIGHIDTVAPAAPNLQFMSTSLAPTRVDFKWNGASDDAAGTGVALYQVWRDGTWLANLQYPEFEDPSVAAGQVHQYTFVSWDFHGNSTSSAALSITVPPAGSIDPRQVGVRPQGSYWGGGGENMDMRSGNLNYSIPLLKPVGRGGLTVPVNLVYNSQMWWQDNGTTWRMDNPVGEGLGWHLWAGSLTPVYDYNTAFSAPLLYVFTDASGADYRLDQVSSGVYASRQGIYLWYDSNAKRLYFKDGTFWVFGCTSAGTEKDAGTMFPTTIRDLFGNYIAIRYAAGAGLSWPDSSSRITQIEDARANTGYTPPVTYSINYDGNPFITTIVNNIGSSEQYSFTYTMINLYAPFDGVQWTTGTSVLSSVTDNATGLTTSFTYDSSGELTQVNLPYGGHLRWTYATASYTGSRNLREIQNRYLMMAAGGTTEATYAITHPGETAGTLTAHGTTVLTDNSGAAAKFWYFNTSGTYVGLPSAYEEGPSGSSAGLYHVAYTWTTNAYSGNPYISSTTTTINYGQANAVSKVVNQSLDRYGNVTQLQAYDFGGTTPKRTYTSTWMHGADGVALTGQAQSFDATYLRNRVASASVSDGSSTVTLATNTYDNGYWAGGSFGQLTTSVTPAGTATYTYDNYGNVATAVNNGLSTNVTMDSTHNYAVPSSIVTGSNSQAIQWNTFLGLTQNTGQNGDAAQIGYDGSGRVSSTTSPYGAVTGYTYVNYTSASAPATVTATTNTHFTRETKDGLGRTVKTEAGTYDGATYTTVSVVDTQYAPCGCSPLGKVSAVSQPYAPGGTVYWTTYHYDWQGRTTSVVLADNSTTTYVYDDRVAGSDPAASFVTITDAAGKKKRFQMDGLGHLTQVTEDPAGLKYVTSYVYDVLEHLTTVTQTRSSTTQTRTFNYVDSGGHVTAFLQSATNPENGTVRYAYNSDNTLASKTDAAGVVTSYTYDSQKRLLTEATGGITTYTYTWDTATGATNALGRLAQVSYNVFQNQTENSYYNINSSIAETYSYTAAGQVSQKMMTINHTYVYSLNGNCCLTGNEGLPLTVSYAYDSEGQRTQMTYPTAYADSGPPRTYATLAYGHGLQERPTTLTDTGTNTVVVSGTTYNPAGQITQMNYLYGVTENRSYNTLNQLTSLTSPYVSFQYGYTAGQNNGQIATATVSGEQVTYVYDSLKRLSSATAPTWGQAFVYDGFGNLTQKNATRGSVPTIVMTVNAANNRVTSSGGSSFTYDANGNMLSGPTLPAGLSYDYRNRLAGAAATMYAYDGANRRVWKGTTSGGQITGETYFLYDLDGTQLGSYTLSIQWNGTRQVLQLNAVVNHIYFAGKHVADYQYGAYSVVAQPDRLGSEMTYYPYGEEKGGLTANDRVKYATYWRDGESGLDYGVNRYYSASMGRFLSADPYMASGGRANPQSWNRYSYVLDDAVNKYDPWGTTTCDANGNNCHDSVDVSASSDPVPYDLGFGAGGGVGDRTPTPILPLDPPTPDGSEKILAFVKFIKKAEALTCKGLPDGMVLAVSGAVAAGIGATGSVELVFNFNTGQISGFLSAGPTEGYVFPGLSGQSGFIWGLGQSNSSYSGPFTSVNIGAGIISATFAASSQGLKNPFDLSTPASASAGVQTPGVTFAYGTTYYTNPIDIGNLNNPVFHALFPAQYDYEQSRNEVCGHK